jgi:hypothetical protein
VAVTKRKSEPKAHRGGKKAPAAKKPARAAKKASASMTGAKTTGTPEQFIAAQPEPRRAELAALHALIRKAAPGLAPRMWNSVVGYGEYHYRYATGREGDWFVIGLASRKTGISLYVCAADEKGYLAERKAPALGKVKVGRSCINIKKLADVDLAMTAALVREAATMAKRGNFGM